MILSLFDGISCGRVALDRAGINVKKYYSSEIDKYAIKISEANYPDIVRLGDVTKWKEWAIDWGSVDLLIGGSPCQGFSFAGKQLAFDDPRSALFFTFVDILNHIKSLNPNVKFLLENVRMAQEHEKIISYYLDVEPELINSALVSAQNRERLYWSNWHIEQPQDQFIFLKDIIEEGFVDCEKSYCIDANYSKGGNLKDYKNKKRRQLVFIQQKARGFNKGGLFEDKSPALTSHSWQDNNHLVIDGYHNVIDLDKYRKGKDKEGNAIFWRKLTPVECERLQTLSDGYTAHVSNSQRYKALGNGWTVDVIAHIFSTMNAEKKIQERLFA
ncbi:MAG: DNA (cytosine-5-)-methyltransferase [Wohlfahrtiimonas sp.]